MSFELETFDKKINCQDTRTHLVSGFGISSKNLLMAELSIALKVFTAHATVQHITM